MDQIETHIGRLVRLYLDPRRRGAYTANDDEIDLVQHMAVTASDIHDNYLIGNFQPESMSVIDPRRVFDIVGIGMFLSGRALARFKKETSREYTGIFVSRRDIGTKAEKWDTYIERLNSLQQQARQQRQTPVSGRGNAMQTELARESSSDEELAEEEGVLVGRRV